MIEQWVKQAKALPGKFFENLMLNQYTSWRIGGPGEFVYCPQSIVDCQQLLASVPETVPITWLGLGSNTLIRDGGVPGLVLITQRSLSAITILDQQRLYVEAGAACAQVARISARQHLKGIEFLAGIPGTIGGALAMNAGCFGHEIWQYVLEAIMIDRQGQLQHHSAKDFEIGYRSVSIPQTRGFLAATLQLVPGNKEQSLAIIRELLNRRADTQPTGEHNCGSVFRNPKGDYAGRLIEASGLKGYVIGDAAVSTKHANFIINRGHATSSDIEALIQEIQQRVLQQFAIELQPEVKVIGCYR